MCFYVFYLSVEGEEKKISFFIKKILVVLKSVILLHRQKRKDILKRYLKQIFFKDSRSTK